MKQSIIRRHIENAMLHTFNRYEIAEIQELTKNIDNMDRLFEMKIRYANVLTFFVFLRKAGNDLIWCMDPFFDGFLEVTACGVYSLEVLEYAMYRCVHPNSEPWRNARKPASRCSMLLNGCFAG